MTRIFDTLTARSSVWKNKNTFYKVKVRLKYVENVKMVVFHNFPFDGMVLLKEGIEI